MAKEKSKKRKPPKKLNQYGQKMAEANPILLAAWTCSECGAVCLGTDGKPPIRCPNRKRCGKLFH